MINSELFLNKSRHTASQQGSSLPFKDAFFGKYLWCTAMVHRQYNLHVPTLKYSSLLVKKSKDGPAATMQISLGLKDDNTKQVMYIPQDEISR